MENDDLNLNNNLDDDYKLDDLLDLDELFKSLDNFDYDEESDHTPKLDDIDDIFDNIDDLFRSIEIQNIYDFNDIFKSMSKYESAKTDVESLLLDSYYMRHNPVKILIGSSEIKSSVGKVFANLLLMKSFAMLGITPNENDIFTKENMTQDGLNEYFNYLIKRFRSEEPKIPYDDIRIVLYETLNEMSDLSGSLNTRVGNSVSYRDLIRIQVEDSDAEKLFHPEVKSGQFSDIEAQFSESGSKIIKYFKEHTDSELHPFVMSETGLNAKQLQQALGFIGLKPTMTGEVIPVTIKDNFLRGFSGLEGYYINSCGTKKALRMSWVPINLSNCGNTLKLRLLQQNRKINVNAA